MFEANIREGIEGRRLCPFRYFGIADDVDYSNIPWRNAQFNINELTAAIATEARARNSLEQFRKHGGSRCIAFCCSQRHADFMADFFLREGVKAVAVHSGPKSAPRATSLERLRDGDVEVIFAVDMFNEGVDVPSIDTVLMLRPTESTIIWLQQIGRGLRISDGKERLVIIDYIGNHRAFLMKLRGMAVVVGRDVESSGRQRELLEAIRDERLILPAGCEVTYETTAIDILQHLLRPTRTEEAMQSFYRDFEERNGVRPLAVETFHAGLSPRSNSERSWLSFVERMGGLNTAEKVAWSTAREFLISLEKTEISRSYKIVLLQAMLEGDTLTPSLPIALRRLGDLEGNLSLRVYEAHTKGFHLKSYVFMNVSEGIAFVGSSNLSGPALTTSIEWNYKIVSSRDTRGFREIRDGFEALFSNPASVPASEDWITRYELRRRIPALGESTVVDELPEPKPQPHAIQLQALAQLEQTREDGFTAGLVVLATGLGKTWLAAFDSDRPCIFVRRTILLLHREEILNQAIQSFLAKNPSRRQNWPTCW